MNGKGMNLNRKEASGETFETEIRILPDGAVVIMDLDENMLDLALALSPNDSRLRQRQRLLRRRARSSHDPEQGR